MEFSEKKELSAGLEGTPTDLLVKFADWLCGSLTPEEAKLVQEDFMHPDSKIGKALGEVDDAVKKILGKEQQGGTAESQEMTPTQMLSLLSRQRRGRNDEQTRRL